MVERLRINPIRYSTLQMLLLTGCLLLRSTSLQCGCMGGNVGLDSSYRIALELGAD